MFQNFLVFMMTGVVLGLLLFGLWKLIRYFIKKHKDKKNINNTDDDSIIDIK